MIDVTVHLLGEEGTVQGAQQSEENHHFQRRSTAQCRGGTRILQWALNLTLA